MRVKSTFRLTKLNHDFLTDCEAKGEGSMNHMVNQILNAIRDAGIGGITDFVVKMKEQK